MTTAITTTQYELSAGSIHLLDQVLATNTWYKEDSQPTKTAGHAFRALEALPELPPRPEPMKDEKVPAYEDRVDVWAAPVFMFQWTDKQFETAKKCVNYYFKQGSFDINEHTYALIRLFKLDADE